MSSPFDVDGPLPCDSALLAFLDIGSFPFLDGDATLSTLAPEALVVNVGLPGLVDVDPSGSVDVNVGLLGLVNVDPFKNLGADSMFSQTASETVTSFLLTQLMERLKRTFDAVRQDCAPPTFRDKLAV
jgi:hypothetical protein